MRLLFCGLFLLVAGCDADDAALSCADIADQAVDISKGRLVKIYNRHLTSESDDRTICHGTGLYSSGQELPTRFQAFVDDDGDTLIKYDTDEYQAGLAAREEAKERAEEQRAEREMEKVDAAFNAALDAARGF